MQFVKMHGIGNDYIYINGFEENVKHPGELSKAISDRHKGIGSDGLIIIDKSDCADFAMKMWNSDGSLGKMCGNGIRCVAKYVYETGMTDKTFLTIETGSGVKRLWLQAHAGRVASVQVDMGEPILEAEKIPVNIENSQTTLYTLKTDKGDYDISCVSMGNPHAVMFVDNPDKADVEGIGSYLTDNKIFPDRANIEFVQVVSRSKLKMRVYERGAGETMACGTGACASFVAAVRNNLCDRAVEMELRGGRLNLEWCQADNKVYMTGTADFICAGSWPVPSTMLRSLTHEEPPFSADAALASNCSPCSGK